MSEQESQNASGKGRPTRSRAEAQAARKAALTEIENNKKAQREEARKARERARAGLLAGDERYFPARDRGPVKAFVRDFIDSRFTVGEVFLPAAFLVIVLSLVPNLAVMKVAYAAWFATFMLMILDTVVMAFRLRRALVKRFDPVERKGALFYAVLRTTQMRRLRVPPPRVRIGGKPRQPKV